MEGFCLLLFHEGLGACEKQAATFGKGNAWENGPEGSLEKEASVLYAL